MAVWPSTSVRVKDWTTEILTDTDLENEFDLLHDWVNDAFNSSTGHKHDGTSSEGPKILTANIDDAAGSQGDVFYSSGTAITRLAAGTSGQFLQTKGAAANPVWASPPSASVGSFSNLVVEQITAATVDIDADSLTLVDSSNNAVTIYSVNLTVDITASGANGLDTGAEAGNTIYYLWVIRKSSDGTVAGLISTASAIGSITFPSGYDQAALVSAVGNNNSSNILDFKQVGDIYAFKTWIEIDGSDTSSTWQSIDLTPGTLTYFVPPALSTYCFGTLHNASSIAVANDSSVAVTGNADRNKYGPGTGIARWELDVLTADTIYYSSDATTNTLWLHGFILNKL